MDSRVIMTTPATNNLCFILCLRVWKITVTLSGRFQKQIGGGSNGENAMLAVAFSFGWGISYSLVTVQTMILETLRAV